MATSKLPFLLSDQSISDWLFTLSKLSNVNSANELNKAIQRLRKEKHEVTEVFYALIQLTPTILFIINTIETSLLSEASRNQGKTPHKVEKLSIQLLRNLSLAFSFLLEDKALPTEEKSQTLYIALQLIGYTQRITTVFHEFPSSTLWKKAAELYLLAHESKLDQQEITLKIKEFKNLPSIETVVKRNLLFSICTSYQLTSSQIQQMFTISEQQCHLLKLNPKNSNETSFIWDLENEQAPRLYPINNSNKNTSVSIEVTEFTKFIQSSVFSDEQSLNQINNQLTGFKKIFHSSLATQFSVFNVIEGINNITRHLNKIDKLKKIQQFSSELADATPISSMSLEPMDYEKNHLSAKTELTPTAQIEIPENAQALKILATKYKQFVIGISNKNHYSIGNILLFCNMEAEPELGIIRNIIFVATSNSTQILIEKIEGKLSSYSISSPNLAHNIAIKVQNKNIELFINPCKLANGTLLKDDNEQVLTLDKLIDCSSYFMRYQT
jgi:hypothetical protein